MAKERGRREGGESSYPFILHRPSMLLTLSAVSTDTEKGAYLGEKGRTAGGSPVLPLHHSFNEHRSRQNIISEEEKVIIFCQEVGGAMELRFRSLDSVPGHVLGVCCISCVIIHMSAP